MQGNAARGAPEAPRGRRPVVSPSAPRAWGRRAGAEVDDTFAHDALGRLVYAQNAQATYRVAYDALDRAVELTDAALGTARRGYDPDGRITQVVYPAHGDLGFPEGIVVRYQYDARGQMIAVSDPVAGSWQASYDAAGRPLDRTYPGGLSHQTSYDSQGFVADVEVFLGVLHKQSTRYRAYDARGYPATLCEDSVSPTCSAASQLQLGYDSLGRLTQVSYPDATSEGFAYDRSGSRTEHTTRQGTVHKYVYDGAGALDRITDPSDVVLEEFTSDAAGRRVGHSVVGGATTSYAYDAAGRLRGVERPGASYAAALAYDPAGYRRERSEADPQGLEVSLYLGEWLEVRTGGARFRPIHAPGIDDVLAEVEEPLAGSPTPRQLLPDGAGSVVGVAVAGGSTVTKRRFEAFGALRTPPDTLPVERGFVGRPTEGDTGLLYLRARHYDPATGQFLQADPLGLLADHPYAYAAGNPIVFRDPFGLAPGESELQTGVDSMSAEADAGDAALAEENSSDGSSSSGSAGIEARAETTGALGNAARLATGTYASSQGVEASPQQSIFGRLGFGLSQGDQAAINRQIAQLDSRLAGSIQVAAIAFHIKDAILTPLFITGTGLAIAGFGVAAAVTAPISVPAAVVIGGVFVGIGLPVAAVGLDLGSTQLNETFGTSLPSTGLLRPISEHRSHEP